MMELIFMSLAGYLVWYAIRHLRAEHRENNGFLTHPYGHPANGATTQTAQPQRTMPLDDQPASVIAEIARRNTAH